ncbi:sulfotransferase domain-containing protein [Cryomorphaceae bacterium]|nr:sulfotransferase domain-containing protein [Cryomorphaceae bacterium]
MSYSGSSLLGFVLGAVPEVWNLGEVKVFPREHRLGRICTCTRPTLECEYWGPLYQQGLTVFNRGSSWKRWEDTVRILLHRPVRAPKESGDARMLRASLEHAKTFEPQSKWLVDTSKSLWRLFALWYNPDIEVKIVYLRRGAKENVASYIKHGHSFGKAVREYGLFHRLSRLWLKKNAGDQVLELSHEDLALKEAEAMSKISQFLDLDYSQYKSQMASREYHIRTGNPRTVDQFRDGFKGFFYDEHWKELLNEKQQQYLDRRFS